MISIHLSVSPSASDRHVATTIIAGREFTAEHKKKSPIPMLARKLTDEGIDASTLAQVFRGTTAILGRPVALSKWAKLDISDDDVKGLKTRSYRPFTELSNALGRRL